MFQLWFMVRTLGIIFAVLAARPVSALTQGASDTVAVREALARWLPERALEDGLPSPRTRLTVRVDSAGAVWATGMEALVARAGPDLAAPVRDTLKAIEVTLREFRLADDTARIHLSWSYCRKWRPDQPWYRRLWPGPWIYSWHGYGEEAIFARGAAGWQIAGTRWVDGVSDGTCNPKLRKRPQQPG